MIKADGGTRTASITGAYVALVQAMNEFVERKALRLASRARAVAAISVGIVDGVSLLDLAYEEDFRRRPSTSTSSMHGDAANFVEVQGTGESHPFTRDQMDELLDLGDIGLRELFEAQRQALAASVSSP